MELKTIDSESGDAIDWFADALQRHPDRADDLKDVLRGQLQTRAAGRAKPKSVLEDEPDDFWDNVPV